MAKRLSGVTPLRDEGGMASMGGSVDCVVLSCFEPEVIFLASMLGQARIRLHRAETIEMADFLLLATGGTVLLADTTFLDGSWEGALSMIENAHPLVAALIYADPVDRGFLVCAQDRGALDVLWKPLDLGRVRSRIWTAHEVTVDRQRWSVARERESEFDRNTPTGVCLEAAE